MIRGRAQIVKMFMGMPKFLCFGTVVFLALLAGCSQIERPKVEPFYAVTVPPPKQELNWSNGKMLTSFDPARAAAAPETDLIRAVYEGLTELDSRTLRAAPGVASSWRSSDDLRKWTFYLRDDAKWSNGEPITAIDFVRSWRRLVEMGDKTANNYLFRNIVGMDVGEPKKASPNEDPTDFLKAISSDRGSALARLQVESSPSRRSSPEIGSRSVPKAQPTGSPVSDENAEGKPPLRLGVSAIDDHTLQVELTLPDKDFPQLVANPIFRPVYGDGRNFETSPLDPNVPTNGAFRISQAEEDVVSLVKSDTYWNKRSIALEQVRLVAARSAEDALEAYKKGDVDVVTNAPLEPVAVKVLAPYDDFRRTAHNALNFYEVNTDRPPFNDRRVRQALALSIDREKLSEGDLQGTTQPAYSFSPLAMKRDDTLRLDVNKAADLLDKAGYPDGAGFPAIRLVINRNDIQQRVAASVARMWKQNLNLDTEIIVKEASEMDGVRRTGDFDLLRRGIVLPTNDELVNLTAVQGSARTQLATPTPAAKGGKDEPKPSVENEDEAAKVNGALIPGPEIDKDAVAAVTGSSEGMDQALFELNVIPLYFPTSYSLIKPYIRGFELNGLDAPSLKEVSIDNNWQPAKTNES